MPPDKRSPMPRKSETYRQDSYVLLCEVPAGRRRRMRMDAAAACACSRTNRERRSVSRCVMTKSICSVQFCKAKITPVLCCVATAATSKHSSHLSRTPIQDEDSVLRGSPHSPSASHKEERNVDVRAAVAHKAGAPLAIETVQLAGPKAGEVMVEIKATGICHTDEFTRSGGDPEGLFPSILGHEGAGIVVEVGPSVTTIKKGDHVIPLYTPECRQCKSCLSRKTNLCTAIRATQGKGVMPDGTSRFSLNGKPVHQYMGCSTF